MIEAMVKLSQCNRRKQAPQKTYSREDLLKYAVRARCFEETAEKTGVKASTEVAEASTTDLSDSSDQVSGSTDGSDTEPAAIKLMSATDLRDGKKTRTMRAPAMPAEWPKAPPGLDRPKPTSLKLQNVIIQDAPADQGNQGTRLNSGAALFVPSFGAVAPGPADAVQGNAQQLRQSIQVLKGALQEWEASNLEEQYPEEPTAPSDGSNLIALQQAISRLSSKDAAVVRAVLQSKEATQNPMPCMEAPMMPPVQMGAMYQGFHDPATAWAGNVAVPAGHMAPPGNFYGQQPFFAPTEWGQPVGQRPSFTPFQGISRQNAHAKPRKAEVPAEDSESLATHLRDLAALDSARVLMVRKINHLSGGDVPASLKAYFKKFGMVDRIMMSATRSATKPARIRPATLGFMVMETAEAALAILADGPEHVVEGVTITVTTFKSHSIGATDNTQQQ